MKASIHIRVDPEALATLLKRANTTAPHAALRLLLGLPLTELKPGPPKGYRKGYRKQKSA